MILAFVVAGFLLAVVANEKRAQRKWDREQRFLDRMERWTR